MTKTQNQNSGDLAKLDQVKQDLRKQLKQRRKNLAAEARALASQQIVDKILGQAAYQEARLIFSFYPMSTEVQVSLLFEPARQAGKQICFPAVFDQGRMEAYIPRDLDHMGMDPYGFATPDPDRDQKVEPQDIDLVLVPLLGFDRDLYRIGYGGGFYDRYISRIPDSAVLLGVAFACQEVERIPRNAFDQKLDLLISEKEIILPH